MHMENLPILVILALAVVGNNNTVSIAAAFLLIVKLLGFDTWFPLIENHGISLGILILTVAILVPVATGRISLTDMAVAFKNPVGILAIVTGIFAAWAAGRGVFFIKESPEAVAALIVGTIAGVCFFKGVAVGPLIAGGMVSLALTVAHLIK
ncbi:MAG: DUF441 domain-containing protein [Veillonellales bacterium]